MPAASDDHDAQPSSLTSTIVGTDPRSSAVPGPHDRNSSSHDPMPNVQSGPLFETSRLASIALEEPEEEQGEGIAESDETRDSHVGPGAESSAGHQTDVPDVSDILALIGGLPRQEAPNSSERARRVREVRLENFRSRLREAEETITRWVREYDEISRDVSGTSDTQQSDELSTHRPRPIGSSQTLRSRTSATDLGSSSGRSGHTFEQSTRRMDSNSPSNSQPRSNHVYHGWAPGTSNTSEHPRPSLNSLRALASRNYSSRIGTHVPSSSTGRSSVIPSNLERRYNMETQRQLELIQQSMMDSEQRPSRRSSSYLSPAEVRYPSGMPTTNTGNSSPGGGFASSVVDSEGNPIDTGTATERPSPRSIVYNLPPSRHASSTITTASQPPRPSYASTADLAQRRRELANAAYDIEQLERQILNTASSGDSSSSAWGDDDYWARYTQMQRQERMERIDRQQRPYLRADRLRRAGAADPTSTYTASPNIDTGPSAPSHRNRSGGRRHPLDELRRDLHELHRDQHPALCSSSSSAEAARDGIKRAIQYLHRIRSVAGECSTRDQSLDAARDEGFGAGADSDDFVTETGVLGPVPETSWLVPGTVFKGSQRAVNVSAITNAFSHTSSTSSSSPSSLSTAFNWGNARDMLRERERERDLERREQIDSAARRGIMEARAAVAAGARQAAGRGDPTRERASWIESANQRERQAQAAAAQQAAIEPRWAAFRMRARPGDEEWTYVRNDGSIRWNGTGGAPPGSGERGGGERDRERERGLDRHYHPQNFHRHQAKPGEGEDTWPVKVTITSVDYGSMTLTGTMEAMNVPNKNNPSSVTSANGQNAGDEGGGRKEGGGANSTITTFLEGEILDLQRFSLETRGYNADSSVDGTYWRRLEPFRSLADAEIVGKMLSTSWLKETIGSEYLLMRWKEKCFVDPSDANQGLTISGFYYISLHRQTGKIEGLYYDPQSSPYQYLYLKPEARFFPAYEFQ